MVSHSIQRCTKENMLLKENCIDYELEMKWGINKLDDNIKILLNANLWWNIVNF